jgi:Peptidase family M28/PDZ domain/PA domain
VRPLPLPLARLLILACGAAACGPAAPPAALPPSPPPIAPAPPPPLAIDDDPASAARIAADVTALASPELGGRGTGEDGARRAADFVAKRFADLGLAPDGDRSDQAPGYLQAFEARLGSAVKRAELRVAFKQGNGRAMTFTKPVQGPVEATLEGEGEAVFVGFGISAPAAHWDDYAGADLHGKIAVVLDGVPPLPPPKTPEAPAVLHPLRDFGGVLYKLRTAREHGAAGAVIIRATADTGLSADETNMGIPDVILSSETGEGLFPTLRLGAADTWKARKPARPRPVPGARFKLALEIVAVRAPSWNVAARLPARAGAAHADEVVVVGAHYDHLGHGGPFSLAPGSHDVHPGADDNASGTALLLEVARRFAALPRGPDRAVLFLSFGAEEVGTLGSRYWVQHPSVPVEKIAAMINADMVGRLRDEKLVVDGAGTSPEWKPLIEAAGQGLGLTLALGGEGFGASDHASFTAVRVPVAFLFTGSHPAYHKPSDTADKINAAGEERVTTLAARLCLAVAEAPARLPFVDAPADPHRGARGGFKVSLGTMPDYAFTGKGVKLDGVRSDSPASRAGLTRGDVIVKLGGHDVGNIHDYMFALGDLSPGAEVVIEVEREGKRVPLPIIPAPGR